MTDYIRRDTAIELMKKEAAEMSESLMNIISLSWGEMKLCTR